MTTDPKGAADAASPVSDTPPVALKACPVIQADRDAAANWFGRNPKSPMRHGDEDDNPLVQAFAAHRQRTDPDAAGVRVPDGWKLVPVEATDAMLLAAERERLGLSASTSGMCWSAMLAAAPSAPLASDAGEGDREALTRMVAIDEEMEAKHPGWMTGTAPVVADAAADDAGFVAMVSRLQHTGDDGWAPRDDNHDAESALDDLIAAARLLRLKPPAALDDTSPRMATPEYAQDWNDKADRTAARMMEEFGVKPFPVPHMAHASPAGMVPWQGTDGEGNTSPADWDGNPVLLRDGSWSSAPDWRHADVADDPDDDPATDVVAYTPKPTAALDEQRAREVLKRAMSPHGWLGEQCVTDILAALATFPRAAGDRLREREACAGIAEELAMGPDANVANKIAARIRNRTFQETMAAKERAALRSDGEAGK